MTAFQQGQCFGLLLLTAVRSAVALTRYASIVEGYREDFKYVAHFGFDSAAAANGSLSRGHLLWQAWTFMADQRLLVYKGDSWFRAYHEGDEQLSCVQRANLSSYQFPIAHGGFYGRATRIIDMPPELSSAPEFWYVALARCREWSAELSADEWKPNGIFMYYAFSFANPSSSNPVGDPFSVDEQGSLLLNYVLCGAYSVLVLVSMVIALRQFCRIKGKLREKTRQSLSWNSDAAMVAFASKVSMAASTLVSALQPSTRHPSSAGC